MEPLSLLFPARLLRWKDRLDGDGRCDTLSARRLHVNSGEIEGSNRGNDNDDESQRDSSK